MESCLGSIYIHKSIAPFAMNLAFLAQKNVFDLVLLGEFLKNPHEIQKAWMLYACIIPVFKDNWTSTKIPVRYIKIEILANCI